MSKGHAPGAPGKPLNWCPGSKSGVGTAPGGTSPVWFTLGRGAVEEVYYPRPDNPCIRDCFLAVTEGTDFISWEKEDCTHKVELIDPEAPAYHLTNHCREGRYRIEKDVIADPLRPAILQRIRFTPSSAAGHRLYALVNTQLGPEACGWLVEERGISMIVAEGEGVSIALASSVPWLKRSVGFLGKSDGNTDLYKHKQMTWLYDRAERGHIVATGQLDYLVGEDWLLVLGFGTDPDAAALTAHAALLDQFDSSLRSYVSGWKDWQRTLLPLDREARGQSHLYRVSTAVMRTHRSKLPAGPIVASLSIPFGQNRSGKDASGYHLTWPRDLVETAGGLLAAGDTEGIFRTLSFLEATQDPDGHWPQNMWLNGKPKWTGIQMDETALTILLVDLARRKGAISGSDTQRFWSMIRKAIGYLVCHGPVTPEDRWEVDGGYSTFTLATEIAALLAAADLARNYDREIVSYLQETADIWNANIERWTYVSNTELAKKIGVDGYYARLGQPKTQATRDAKTQEGDENTVSTDALALVRFGLRKADDPRIVNTRQAIDQVLRVDLGYGPGWLRYNGDRYGEHADGEPFDDKDGQGRAWPLFCGERGHYELALGQPQKAEAMLALMEKTATETGLIPEQVWDADDIPAKGLFRGKPTTSACPLAWAQAEYVKLLRSLRDGAVFDCPPQTSERYGKEIPMPKIRLWKFNHKIEELPVGYILRVELTAPATLRWTEEESKQERQLTTRDTGLGLHTVDLPTQHLPADYQLKLTIQWTDRKRGDHCFQITMRATEVTT